MKSTIARLAFALGACTAALAEDAHDFSTTPDSSWTRVDPLNRTTFDFSAGTARFSITTPSLPEALAFGPGRCYFIAPSTFTRTLVTTDLLAWSPDGDRTFSALLARIQPSPGPGAINGYSLSILNGPTHLQLHRVNAESPTLIAGPGIIPALNPARRYRLALLCDGPNITGALFDTENLLAPLVTVSAVDATFATGRTGLAVSTDELAPLTTTFDDFLATDAAPPVLTLTAGPAGFVKITRDARRSPFAKWEATTDLTGTLDTWAPHFPATTFTLGNTLETQHPIDSAARFFRLRQ